MADSKTTALTELTSFDGDEQFYVVDDDDGTPTSKRVTIETVRADIVSIRGVRAYASSATSISNAAFTAVSLQAESYDSDGFHEAVTNPSRLTVPTGLGGYYMIVGSGGVEEGTGGNGRYVEIYKNGTTRLALASMGIATVDGFEAMACVSSGPVYLNATDYVQLRLFQDGGGARNSLSGEATVFLALWRVGT